MPPEYTVQPFTPDSYALMKDLFHAAYNVTPDRKQFQKKYGTAALGHDVIGFIAVHEPSGTAAAFYGVFPVQVAYGNSIMQAALSGDTMTHPAHRKKGLFVALARRTFEACRAAGVRMVFGLPNENSYPGFVGKLGWRCLDNIRRLDLKRRLKTFPLPKLLQRLGAFAFYLRYARAVLRSCVIPAPQHFHNKLPSAKGRLRRDAAYLAYKESEDKVFIRVGEVVFWVKLADIFWIGDCSDYEKIDGQVLKALRRLAFRLGYNTISFHLNESIPLPPTLRLFKQHNSAPSCFLFLDDGIKEDLVLTGADFDTW